MWWTGAGMVNTALLPPKLILSKFLLAICQQQSKDALQTSILWIFRDHPVNCPNQAGYKIISNWDAR